MSNYSPPAFADDPAAAGHLDHDLCHHSGRPGGPEGVFFETGRFIDPQVVETFRHRLGLDQPVYIQYVRWLGAALTGDMGVVTVPTSRYCARF